MAMAHGAIKTRRGDSDASQEILTFDCHPPQVKIAIKRRRVGDRVSWLTGLGLGLTLTMEITTLSNFDFANIYEVLLMVSRFIALSGSYLALIGLLLIARIGWIEKSLGHDRLVVWHRKSMPYALYLIALHVLLVNIASAGVNNRIVYSQLWNFITSSPWMLPALVGFILMILAGVTSYKVFRQKMKYETWWVIHLYTYLAVALSFMHQIVNGAMFQEHPLNKWYWTGLYIFVAAQIIFWRILIPLIQSLRHNLRVSRIVHEGPGVVSVYVSGKDITKLRAQGGQFFNWRFLNSHMWHENHPFSLSASPREDEMRFTVKALGDSTSNYADLAIGTRVMIEGPYGIFTREAAFQEKYALLVAGGVGITPLRALIEELPSNTHIELIYRASNPQEFVLRDELEQLAKHRNLSIHFLAGSRKEHPITEITLKKYAPRLLDSDVYVCGPQPLVEAVTEACAIAGLPANRVHHEAFEYHSV